MTAPTQDDPTADEAITSVRTPHDVRTWSMWVFALDPLAEVAILTALAVAALPFGDEAERVVTGGVTVVANLVFAAAGVVLAAFDRRTLLRRGVRDPMHWGWALLPLVYLIGRGVVLKRRTGFGTMLTWVGVAVFVAALAIGWLPIG